MSLKLPYRKVLSNIFLYDVLKSIVATGKNVMRKRENKNKNTVVLKKTLNKYNNSIFICKRNSIESLICNFFFFLIYSYHLKKCNNHLEKSVKFY